MSKGGKDRAKAKRIVEEQRAAERRRRVTLWTSVTVVAVLVIAGLIGWAASARQDQTNAGNLTTPGVAVDEGTAFAVGSGPVVVDVYEDFMCPVCRAFEDQTASTIRQLITGNKVTVRYHPVSILDRFSNGTRYSTRAAGAAAAAAADGRFVEYHDVLFANQPAENSDGLDDAKLIELGRSVGLGESFAAAVRKRTYDGWAAKVTETFAARGFGGTPTIVVAGRKLDGVPTAAQFTQAVDRAAG